MVEIIDDDHFGTVSFTSSSFFVNENSGQFTVTVVREYGSAEELTVNYEVNSGSAEVGNDFAPIKGTLVFAPGQLHTSFTIVVNDDELPESAETINLILSDAKPVRNKNERAILGSPNMATLTIIDNENLNEPAGAIDSGFIPVSGANDFVNAITLQSDGRVLLGGDFTLLNGLKRNRFARLNADGTVDNSLDIGLGFNDSVKAIIAQPDGRIIASGMFTQFNGVNRNRLVRLNSDGSIDDTFNPGGGANNPINSMALQNDGKIVIVGDFTEYNGIVRKGIARINSNGVLDESFDPGDGADLTVQDVKITRDSKIIVVGGFTQFNGESYDSIVKLNSNGSIDKSFHSQLYIDDTVRTIALQDDGKIIIGGFFNTIGSSKRGGIARLNVNGTIDRNFSSEIGANGSIYEVFIQPDGRILVGGSFSKYNGLYRICLVRLLTNGMVDPTVNYGFGANGSVLTIDVKSNGKTLIGGGFTSFNEINRPYFAQIHGGVINGSGRIEFKVPTYKVGETGTNALIQIVRRGGLKGEVSVQFETRLGIDENPAVPGLDYDHTLVNLLYPEGELLKIVEIPIIDDSIVEPVEFVDLILSNHTKGTEGFQSEQSFRLLVMIVFYHLVLLLLVSVKA